MQVTVTNNNFTVTSVRNLCCKDTAIRLFNIWSTIGKPRCGVEFENMKRDKLRYKLSK